MNRKLIFVDTETTGLYADQDQLIELTWATELGAPVTLYFGVQTVNPMIDDLIGFTRRGIAKKGKSSDFDVNMFLSASESNTMVAANPGFDQGFLVANDLWRFHYRMLDIESYAMAKLGLDYVPGMNDIYERLIVLGHKITEPNHSSRADVLAMRDSYNVLKDL